MVAATAETSNIKLVIILSAVMLMCNECTYFYIQQVVFLADEGDKKAGPSIGQWRKPQIKPNRMSDDKTEVPPLELLHARKQQKQVST